MPCFVTYSNFRANTGKTSVIAATVCSLMASGNPSTRAIWLVAQSNVAVKNMAKKLADIGFLDFGLLVSKDSHFDWSVILQCCFQ
jgi:hypothetical protein